MSIYNKVKRLVGKAIYNYEMLEENDNILVGVSGGEDSLVLLYFLAEWRKKIKKNYNLIAVYLDMGFSDSEVYKKEIEHLKSFVKQFSIEFIVKETDCAKRAFESVKTGKKNPCFICSWYRRKYLFKLAEELKANKLALGHHLDDAIVTFFLNLFYHGEISTIKPVQEMFKGKLYIIRPLFLLEKKLIKKFVKKMEWKVLENPCPFKEKTKRKFVENFLNQYIFTIDPKIKKSITKAIFNVKLEYLPNKMPF